MLCVDHVWTTSPPSVFLVGVRMRVCVCTGREPGVSWGAKQWFEKKKKKSRRPCEESYTVYEAVYIVYSIHRLALMALYPVSFYGLAVAL